MNPKPSDEEILVNIDHIGYDWLLERIDAIRDEIVEMTPVEFSENYRYLPESVTSQPGPMSFDLFPYMREILDCFDVNNQVREINFKKGVQVGYTTLLESAIFYMAFHVKTIPIMFLTAEKEMAKQRVDANFIPMIQHSQFSDKVRSNDIGNNRKTGMSPTRMEWEGGGYLLLLGAKNPNAARMHSVLALFKDETDAWDDTSKDGNLDKASDDRTSSYTDRRKIARGSTPRDAATSKIDPAFLKGDQRYYQVLCRNTECLHSQTLVWKDDGGGGIHWDYDENGMLDDNSVHYKCVKCLHAHYEHDKTFMFAAENGAYWKPTAVSSSAGIRSYHLSGLYSPVGFQPWAKCVKAWLDAWDVKNNRVKSVDTLKVFYNNVLGESFEDYGGKITFEQASAHRRTEYSFGQVPNYYAEQYAGGKISLITMQIDVQKSFLSVGIMGWAPGMRCFLIDYLTIPGDDFTDLQEPGWNRVRDLIEKHIYVADDGRTYRIGMTFIDSGYANEPICKFCKEFDSNVYPILGRARAEKNAKIQEFAPFKTQIGTSGYKITVDYYKERLAPVLRRSWSENDGSIQPFYHFNAPVDVKDAQLKELTNETRMIKKDDKTGAVSYIWKRSGRNELWDIFIYGNAIVEMIAWVTCIDTLKQESINWDDFWTYLENQEVYYSKPSV